MSPLLQLNSVADVRAWRGDDHVGFVPTMGALHAGHLTLVERARAECVRVIVSIFVNPTQFNDPKDLEAYPRPLARDLDLLAKAGVDAVFLPEPRELYRDEYRFQVREQRLSRELCGAHRPGHFEGVLTVVLKLLNVVRPSRAYFGEKDFQQLSLIRDMVDAFFMEVEIVPVATVREDDGLAMSSRNVRLSPKGRAHAPLLARILRDASTATEARARLNENGFEVDYVEDRDGRRFAAVVLENVRLIDNVIL